MNEQVCKNSSCPQRFYYILLFHSSSSDNDEDGVHSALNIYMYVHTFYFRDFRLCINTYTITQYTYTDNIYGYMTYELCILLIVLYCTRRL